jgi:flagellar capping protein FliD
VRDPNLPPRPNLLSQAKELRLTKEVISNIQTTEQRHQEELSTMRSKMTQMQARLDALTAYIQKNR